MVWSQAGDKPLPESMIIQFTDAHDTSPSLSELKNTLKEGWVQLWTLMENPCTQFWAIWILCRKLFKREGKKAIIFLSDCFLTPWPFRPKGYWRRLRLSVCPSVCKFYLVRTIARHRFVLELPNLHQTCILGYSHLIFKIGVIDLDLHGHFGHFNLEV